ncbi:MAG TPA: GPP34 family phosphoprotein [bacterium]|nr:GPP34 family phosphoprotein [bacterium]HPN43146.1 GPP34 family phosphoprotein [bacterium]
MLLYEELLLLALDNQKGSIHFSASSALPFSLAGAILTELYLQGRISIVEKKLVVIDKRVIGILLLDEALHLLIEQSKDKSMEYWIESLVNKINNLQDKCITGLLELGILQKEEHKFIFIPYYRYPEYNPRPEIDLRDKLNQTVLEHSWPEEHLYLLLVLIKACNLVNVVFTRENKKIAQNRLKQLVAASAAGTVNSLFAAELYKAINNALAASTAAATSSISCRL